MQREKIENNPLLQMSIEFSLNVIEYCKLLDDNKQYVISKQLLRSATSVGANSVEAQNAESKADFIHKLKIAAKEADEVQYWLILCERADSYPSCSHLQLKLEGLQKILNAIITSAKKKNNLVP
jgi:four helix bundle protein